MSTHSKDQTKSRCKNHESVQQLIEVKNIKPGIPCRVEFNGQGILLCLVEGKVHAVHDTCTHEDVSLSLGVLCEHRLRCPLHGSEFDIRTGKVLDEPADVNLPVYRVRVINGWICLL